MENKDRYCDINTGMVPTTKEYERLIEAVRTERQLREEVESRDRNALYDMTDAVLDQRIPPEEVRKAIFMKGYNPWAAISIRRYIWKHITEWLRIFL